MSPVRMPKGVTMREATGSESARRLVGQAREFLAAKEMGMRKGASAAERARLDAHVKRIEGMGQRGQEMWSEAVRLAQRGRK